MTPYQILLTALCSVLALSGISVLGAGGYLYQQANSNIETDFDPFVYKDKQTAAYICFGVGGAATLASIAVLIVLSKSFKQQ